MYTWKNRGHFCNYCRKIIANKVRGKYQNPVININPTIWKVWNSQDKETMDKFVGELACLKVTESAKLFNNQLKHIRKKYGEGKREMEVLECSSKGDKRYSAFYAKVAVNGIVASIEEHYQLSKVFRCGDDYVYASNPLEAKAWQKSSNFKLVAFKINGVTYELKYMSQWYKMLWVKYLDKHSELVAYASKFDDFHDMFRSKHSLNCQADVVKQYIKHGRNSIMLECQELCKLIKANSR